MSLSVSFLACVLFLQDLYWFAYPIFILISICSTWVFNFFIRFRDFLSTIPVLNILVSATFVGDGNQEMQGENQETELEAHEEEEFGVEDEPDEVGRLLLIVHFIKKVGQNI